MYKKRIFEIFFALKYLCNIFVKYFNAIFCKIFYLIYTIYTIWYLKNVFKIIISCKMIHKYFMLYETLQSHISALKKSFWLKMNEPVDSDHTKQNSIHNRSSGWTRILIGIIRNYGSSIFNQKFSLMHTREQ